MTEKHRQVLWRDVLGYEGLYSISEYGEVRSKRGAMKTRPNFQGYLGLALYKDKKPKGHRIHVLVLEAFNCKRPKGMQVRHIDGNKLNNHISNLAWGTGAENQADRILHGTDGRGSKNSQSKLTEEQVYYIRTSPKKIYELSRELKLHRSTIYQLRAGKMWAHFAPETIGMGITRR